MPIAQRADAEQYSNATLSFSKEPLVPLLDNNIYEKRLQRCFQIGESFGGTRTISSHEYIKNTIERIGQSRIRQSKSAVPALCKQLPLPQRVF